MPAIEVYNIDPKIRQLAHVLAEQIYDHAKSKGLEEYMASTPELRFVGMLGGWAYGVSVYDSITEALTKTTFGGSDECDLEFDGKLFDVKTNLSTTYLQLNINKRQFEKPRKKEFTAYIAANVSLNQNLKIKELIDKCDSVRIFGYAKPKQIRWVFDNYKVGQFDDYYGVFHTKGHDDRPWCFINIKKLHDVNKFVDDATDKFFTDKNTSESVDPKS